MKILLRDILNHILSDYPLDEITKNSDRVSSDKLSLISEIITQNKTLQIFKTRMEEISCLMENSKAATDDIASASHEIAELSGKLKRQEEKFTL